MAKLATFPPTDFGFCPPDSLPWWTQPTETRSHSKACNSPAALSVRRRLMSSSDSWKRAPLTTPQTVTWHYLISLGGHVTLTGVLPPLNSGKTMNTPWTSSGKTMDPTHYALSTNKPAPGSRGIQEEIHCDLLATAAFELSHTIIEWIWGIGTP